MRTDKEEAKVDDKDIKKKDRRRDRDRDREGSRDRGRRESNRGFGWSKRRVPISRSGRNMKGRGLFVSLALYNQ